jgi:hypothetical protein
MVGQKRTSGIARKSSSNQFLKPCVEGAWEQFPECSMGPNLTEIAVSYPEQGTSLSCYAYTLRNYRAFSKYGIA